jgi:hypothetical protein
VIFRLAPGEPIAELWCSILREIVMKREVVMKRIVSMLVVATAMVVVVPTRGSAETWPSLETYVNQCVLIVKCRTEFKEKTVRYRVVETWKGRYSPDLFYHKPPAGYLYSGTWHGNESSSEGREVIFFFTADNQPAWTKGKLLDHSTSFVVKDGKVIYASTDRSGYRKEYTVAAFKKVIVAVVEKKARHKPEAAGRPSQAAAKAFPLAGRWLLTMPRGFEYDATLEPAGEVGLYRLRCGALNLQGLYEVRGGHLTLAKPDNLHLAGLAWKVRNNNSLLLTEQPDQAHVGSDYRGATLGRQKQAGRIQR